MGSTIVLKVPELDALKVGTLSNNSADLIMGEGESKTVVGTITYTKNGVKIKAGANKDIMYWNETRQKFETVKATKESKEITFAGSLRVKVAGIKPKGSTPETFGSMELVIKNDYTELPAPSTTP